jgi:hypothetical protein
VEGPAVCSTGTQLDRKPACSQKANPDFLARPKGAEHQWVQVPPM